MRESLMVIILFCNGQFESAKDRRVCIQEIMECYKTGKKTTWGCIEQRVNK